MTLKINWNLKYNKNYYSSHFTFSIWRNDQLNPLTNLYILK
jgi:hypothetical protein